MNRKFYNTLLNWKNDNLMTPLMVVGARQIGKTYIIEQFCKENFKENITINLDKQERIRDVFEKSIDPINIIKGIEIVLDKKIDIDNTVIFFDEIQVSERAITSLKYFCEDEKPYKIICAGSLLGVKLSRFKSSFPVGKVIIKDMYPMDFEEFLMAIGKELWIEAIRENYCTLKPLIIHDELLELYRTYLCIGGMPQCIKNFINNNNDILFYKTDIVNSIIKSYIADMGKYINNKTEAIKIEAVYNSIPKQLAKEDKKFQYTIIDKKARKKYYESAIDWLVASSMVCKCNLLNIKSLPLTPPIKFYENLNSFKFYLNDVGILTYLSKFKYNDIILDEDMIHKGILTENYVANQFRMNEIPLYYWKGTRNAEVDFIIHNEDGIIPVEVKSSDNTQSKSLKTYIETFNPKYAIRISSKNFSFNNNIKTIPLYAVFCIK